MKTLWATKKGAPEYMKELITEVEERIPVARKWASEQGYDRFRVADIDLSQKPNFAATIRKRK